MTVQKTDTDVPQAVIRPERRISWAWVLPVIALVLAGWLAYRSWAGRGVAITVRLDEGHGLRVGDDVRYRGIAIGEVQSIDLEENLDGVVVRAALQRDAARHIARAGARFWVVRPQFGLSGAAGLETVVGPRYLAALPGRGSPQRTFVGLPSPPIVESVQAGDLEIVLQAAQRSNLRAGAPVMYREVPVGRILSVGLASDGTDVEARVHIDKAYTQLIRPKTRFWSTGGLEAKLGLSGLVLKMASLESLLTGGVALATPPNAGDIVRTGHRFTLAAEPEDEWLEWRPLIFIGSNLLPPGAVVPAPLRATIGWEEGRWITAERSRHGWVLQTDEGLLGPLDLFKPGGRVHGDSAVLEVAGKPVPLPDKPKWTDGRLAILDVQVTDAVWPGERWRAADQPENCIAVADPAAAPLPLDTSRLRPGKHVWNIDPAVSIDESWHGASVLSRADGRLIGMLLVDEDSARVALLPSEWRPPV